MTEEYLDVLDKKTHQIIGKEKRNIIHSKGLLHRSVNIFIKNSKGEILLQKRSPNKDLFPNTWDLSCAEHLQAGETFLDGALRGLKEELNITLSPEDLSIVWDEHEVIWQYNDTIDHEINVTYECVYDGEIIPDPNEVSQIVFKEPKSLFEEMQKNEEKFTPWMIKEYNYYYCKYFKK